MRPYVQEKRFFMRWEWATDLHRAIAKRYSNRIGLNLTYSIEVHCLYTAQKSLPILN